MSPTPFRRVVVGIDGRAGGRSALRLARALAPDAVVILVAAYADESARGAALERLRAVREAADGAVAMVAVAEPSPAGALQRVASHRRADLIVVGSSHRSAGRRVLAGDVARATLQDAPCPVAVAVPGEDHAPTRIGVGYDGRLESAAALSLAAALAAAHGARLDVLFAVTPPVPPGSPGHVYLSDLEPEIERWRAAAERRLAEALEALQDVDAHGRCTAGRPEEQLKHLSKSVDVLIVGSRGVGPIRRVLLGSTSDAILRGAHCPVVVVPRPAGDRAGQS